MQKQLDLIVPVENKYLKELPFGLLKTRNGVATVMSYLDDSDAISHLMQ